MKNGFLKYAAFAVVSALMLAGCSNDSSNPISTDKGLSARSSSSQKMSSSSSWYTTPVPATQVSPILSTSIDIGCNRDKSECAFAGSAFLEELDTAAYPDGPKPYFTSVDIKLMRVGEDKNLYETPLSSLLTFSADGFSREMVNLTGMNTRLKDPYKTECGNYRLFVTYYATIDAVGSADYQPDKFTHVDSLDFTREEEYCIEEPAPPSSSSAPDPELFKKEAKVTIGTGKGFSFATGKEVPESEADISFSLNDVEEIILNGRNGFTVTDYMNGLDNNYDDDWDFKFLPPEPVHMSDFRFNTNSLSEKYKDFERFFFCIAIGPNYNPETGEDFYALVLKERGNIDAKGKMDLTIVYYQKK